MRARRLALAGLCLVLSGCSDRVDPPRHALLITVDTLRADHTSLYGYERDTTPRLREAFAGGRVFERAYAAEANTAPSLVSLLSGRLPQDHGVRLLYQQAPRDLVMLPDVLRAAGFATAAVVSNIVLTDEALGIADRFDHYDDSVDEPQLGLSVFERVASRTSDAALAWLATRDPADRTFLWVHYIDPHGPYTPPADGPRDFTHEGSAPLDPARVPSYGAGSLLSRDALEWIDLYDEEVAFADREVGRLLDGHRALGFGDALIVFTSDHGETLAESERWFFHGHHVLEPLLRVPLALRGPGVTPGRPREPTSLIDVAASIVELLGVARHPGLGGRSLEGGATAPVFSEATRPGSQQWRTAISGRRKWMLRVSSEGEVVERFEIDPAREHDPAARRTWRDDDAPAAALMRLVEADPDPGGIPAEIREGHRIDAPKVAPRADADAIEKLRSLGYVE